MGTTVSAVTIATTTAGPMFFATRFTLKVHVAKFATLAAVDRMNDFQVPQWNTVTVLLKIRRRVLPEAVRDRRHVFLLSPKDLLDDFACVGFGDLG